MRRRRWARWGTFEWPVVWGLTGLAVALGYAGFARAGLGDTWLDRVYLSLQLFVLQSGHLVEGSMPWSLQAARFLAPLTAAYTATKALMAIFADQLRRARIRFLRGHVVIAGAGRKAQALAAAFRARGDSVVVVERDPEAAGRAGFEEAGVPILVGDATDPAILRRAGLRRAACLLATAGDDGTNAEIASAAHAAARDRTRPLTCVVHVVDHRLGRLLDERWPAGGDGPVRLEFFDTFDRGASALLDAHPPFGAEGAAGAAHVLVVGLGRLGENVLVQAVRRWRRRAAGDGARMSVTAIDRVATRKRDTLCARWPRLPEVCRVEAFDLDVEEAPFERGDFLDRSDPPTVAYVCFDDEALALSTAMDLRRLLPRPVPIVVRMEREAGLATLLGGRGPYGSEFEGIHAFPLIDRTSTPELALASRAEAIARALHEGYVRSRTGLRETSDTNPSLVPWDALPESLRESNRRQAAGIGRVLGAGGWRVVPQRDWDAEPIRFAEADVERLARAEHERWVDDLRRDGWRRAGTLKDARAKTHPNLVPWEELSEDVREIDRAIVRDLPGLLAEEGYAVARSGGPAEPGGSSDGAATWE